MSQAIDNCRKPVETARQIFQLTIDCVKPSICEVRRLCERIVPFSIRREACKFTGAANNHYDCRDLTSNLGRRDVMWHKTTITLGVVLLVTGAVAAQESRSEVSLQGAGFFTKDSSGNGTLQRGTETGGFLIGYRYHFNRWLAAEAVYGYDRNTQQYFAPAGFSRV
jgi:hypothetical protein